MEKRKITTAELDEVLTTVVQRIDAEHPISGALFQLQKNTGLRVCEVQEVSRWTAGDAGTYTVQLSKREGTRIIDQHDVPELIRPYYDNRQPFTMQTYSSLNNSYKRNAPVLIFNSDERRTTSHAFRYLFAKQLYAVTESVSEVAAVLGHINQANTARYIFDDIYMYV